jgi:tetratricopeptide (TPR) repeat protein
MSPSIGLRFSLLVAAAVLLAQPGFGQRGGQGSPTGTGSPAGGTGMGTTTGTVPGVGTTRNPNTIPNTIPNTTPQPTTQLPPIFVSGRVMLEDGTPPPQSVVIERVCSSGQPHAEGHTDSKGYFSFELGSPNPGVMQDASEEQSGFGGFGGIPNSSSTMNSTRQSSGYGGMNSDNRFMNCELRAQMPGYRSQSLSLVNHRAMDNPDVGVILLHRIGESEGTTVSARTLAAPKNARKAFDKGFGALKKQKADEAEKEFAKAVQIDSNFAAAWCELGKLQAAKSEFDAAHQSFEASVKADPKFVIPYIELSLLEYRAQKWQALADVSAEAAKLDAFEYPQAYLLNALANYNLKKFDAAEKSAREAERLDTQHRYPKSAHILGVILANRQDYTGAAVEFRNYLKFAPNAPDAATVKGQLQQVEQITAQGAVKPPQPQQQQQ